MRTNGIAIVVLCAAIFAAGCNKRPRVVALPPPAPPAPAVPPPPSAFDLAERAFIAGSYDEAARGYESYLRTTPSGGAREKTLFHLGVVYALRQTPAPDWTRTASMFRQLNEEYPNSAFKSAANLILSLHSELEQVTADNKLRDQRIKQLTTELDRLKKIDADRRRRP